MPTSRQSRRLVHVLVTLILLSCGWSGIASASMIPTRDAVLQEQVQYDRQQLLSALDSEQLQQQLIELGLDPDQARDRVASLTAAELAQLNQHLAEQPAGGILGVILALFVLFVITDMLCATDLFTFVSCINK